MIVDARVDDHVLVNGDVPVDVRQGAKEVAFDAVWHVAPTLPDKIAGHGVDRLDDVFRVGHVQHAAVGERRGLLAARRHRA